jgi:16S rRNA (cytosine1402-N4)-methyltransferase
VTEFVHEPVMLAEVVGVFAGAPAGTLLDATLGFGGHAEAILERHEQLAVLGIDQDADALPAARRRLERFGDRVAIAHARFDRLTAVMQDHDVAALSGALFDLGVSSPQLDRPERGFSYRGEGPLDMRMDRAQARTAADVVNTYDVEELARVIRRHGDERFARRIATAIVAARPISTTTELAGIVTAAIPAATRRTGGHPAKRTFQALRIEVNGELSALPDALDAAIGVTKPAGRIAVLTYHSGEDRIVKDRFRVAAGVCDCPAGLPCACGAVPLVRRVRAPRTATREDAERNRRARSARLRVVERVGDPDSSAGRPAPDDRSHEESSR